MKEFDVHLLLNVVKQGWRVALLTAMIGAVGSFAVSKWILKPVYQASVVLYFGIVLGEGESDTETPPPQYDPPPQRNQSYNSYVSQNLALGLSLVMDYKELLNTFMVREKVAELIKADTDADHAAYSVSVELLRQTRLIKINVKSHNPRVAMTAANAYAQVFEQEISHIFKLRNIQMIDAAREPQYPLSPNIRRNSILGFFLGGGVVFGIFLLLNLMDSAINDPGEVSEKFHYSVLGGIPFDKRLMDSNYTGTKILSIENYGKSSISESFRAMRLALRYSGVGVDGRKAKVILLTSSIPNEGKSFNCANLAASLAEDGNRVLLINCDLRKPSLQRFFKAENTLGLVNVLIDKRNVEDVVLKNQCDLALDVLLSGPLPANPSCLLGSKSFRDMLNALRDQYDYIILDTPPCIAIADAAVLSGYADGVLLVIRAGYTKDATVRSSINILTQSKANIIGIVLNRVFEKNHLGYGYGYYGYCQEDNHNDKNIKAIVWATIKKLKCWLIK